MENYQNIGKMVSAFGIKGELVLEHHLGEKPGFGKIKALFLEETNGKLIPYFLESFKNRKEGETLVLLEGISTPERELLKHLHPSAGWDIWFSMEKNSWERCWKSLSSPHRSCFDWKSIKRKY
jgi:hypothetical protein